MSTDVELEARIRRGLEANARAVPPAPASWLPAPRPIGRPAPGRRWLPPVGAVAAVLVVALLGAVVVNRRAPVVVTPATEPEAPATTAVPVVEPRAGTGHVPGRAVLVDEKELATFDAAGRPTGTRRLDPLKAVFTISSDLDGGWVACGRTTDAPLPGFDPPNIQQLEAFMKNPPEEFRAKLMWFPADREPVVVAGDAAPCRRGSFTVVDSPDGATIVYSATTSPTALFRTRVLATGEDRLAVDGATDPLLRNVMFLWWTASPGQVLIDTGGFGGLRLHDLATGGPLPLPDIEPKFPSMPVLAPDGLSMAVIAAPDGLMEPAELVVYDLTTGAARHRERLDMTMMYAQISYDGTVVAVGSRDTNSAAKVSVIDLGTGARHVLDVRGVLV